MAKKGVGTSPGNVNQPDRQVGNVGKMKGGKPGGKSFGKGISMDSVRTTQGGKYK